MEALAHWLMFADKIIVAGGLGAAVGLERQWRQRMASLRTNALVASGAAAFAALAGLVGDIEDSPTRIAAQVVSGVGFLGAGVIFRDGGNVRGLNTAATIWCSAAVGVLAGWGFLVEAAITAVVVVSANVLLRPLAQRVNQASPGAATELGVAYAVKAVCLDKEEQRLRVLLLRALADDVLALKGLSSENVPGTEHVQVTAELVSIGRHDKHVERITSRLCTEPGVAAIKWEIALPSPDAVPTSA